MRNMARYRASMIRATLRPGGYSGSGAFCSGEASAMMDALEGTVETAMGVDVADAVVAGVDSGEMKMFLCGRT